MNIFHIEKEEYEEIKKRKQARMENKTLSLSVSIFI